jgi:hypothetical protein
LLSGLAEPLGAAIGYVGLRFFTGGNDAGVSSYVMGFLFGDIAGIMVYISLDVLLPTSRAYGKGHDSLFGLVTGMLVMALSLLLMKKCEEGKDEYRSSSILFYVVHDDKWGIADPILPDLRLRRGLGLQDARQMVCHTQGNVQHRALLFHRLFQNHLHCL